MGKKSRKIPRIGDISTEFRTTYLIDKSRERYRYINRFCKYRYLKWKQVLYMVTVAPKRVRTSP